MGERRYVGEVRFRARDAGRAFKEKLDGHAENVRDLLQPAGADPVDALLVFLDLLEGKVKAVGQGGLRHAEHQAAHPYARADMLVGRVGSFDRHHSAFPLAGALRISTGRKLPQRRMPPAHAPQLAVGEGVVPRSLRFCRRARLMQCCWSISTGAALEGAQSAAEMRDFNTRAYMLE